MIPNFQEILDKIGISFEPMQHKYFKKADLPTVIKPTEIASVNQIIDKVLGNVFAKDNLHMRLARDKGTLIHNAISVFIKTNKEPDLPMIEFRNFLKLSLLNNVTWDLSEQIIYNNIEGMEYCGTLDLFSLDKEEISDIKTGSTKQLKKWRIQLSMYAQALRDVFGLKVSNGSILWLHDDHSEYIPITLLSKAEIADFLRKYYFPNTNTPKEEEIALKCLNSNAIQELDETLTAIEIMEEKIKSIKEKIKIEMEQRNITQIKLGNRLVSYVAPTVRESIDTKKLKSEFPDVWSSCKRESKVSSSIRIK